MRGRWEKTGFKRRQLVKDDAMDDAVMTLEPVPRRRGGIVVVVAVIPVRVGRRRAWKSEEA